MSINNHPLFVSIGPNAAAARASVGAAGTGAGSGDLAVRGALWTTGVNTVLVVEGAANTGVTASEEASDVLIDLDRTVTWATGALTNQRAVKIKAPTLAFVAASTVTNAATVYIDRAPVAGTNATITNSFALWVDAGATRLDGNLGLNGSAPVAQGAHIVDIAAFTDPPSAVEMAALRTKFNALLTYLRSRGDIASS